MSRRAQPQSRVPDMHTVGGDKLHAVAGYFNANTVGFSDHFVRELVRDQNFPKYSISYSKAPPYNNIIEVALAGYSPNDINVSWDPFSLHITTRSQEDGPAREETKDDGRRYQHSGIARRNFQLRFLLGPNVTDVTAHFAHGILTVEIEISGEQTLSQEVQIGTVAAPSKMKPKRVREKEKDELRVLAGIKPVDEVLSTVLAESGRRQLYNHWANTAVPDPADGKGPQPSAADEVIFDAPTSMVHGTSAAEADHAPLTEPFSNNGSFSFNASSDQPTRTPPAPKKKKIDIELVEADRPE